MVSKSKLIYVSHFLSAWGDRMWRFAIALFLMDLASNSLLLPAIYGLTLAGSVLTLGPVVGTIIDKTPRLPTAQASVIIQNMAIAACAAILLVHKLSLVPGDWFILFVKIMCVFLGTVAHLGSTASTIILEKDWIVVIAAGDNEMLSNLNSTLRRIDLFTKLLAPMAVGQLITLVNMTFGCAFVAGWNVISMFIEYIMLQIVYNNTPMLAHRTSTPNRYLPIDGSIETTDPAEKLPEKSTDFSDDNAPLISDDAESDENAHSEYASPPVSEHIVSNPDEESLILSGSTSDTSLPNHGDVETRPCWKSVFDFILIIPRGWGLFMSQSVALAGMGLAFLYMTVLGFDSITVSYAYNQCFSEFFVGLLMGASAITGILSTFAFTPMSKRFGLIRTGQFSSFAHVLALGPCVYSVFAPGSPFYMLPWNENSTSSTTPNPYYAEATNEPYWEGGNMTTSTDQPSGSSVFFKCIDGISPPSSYLSLSMLMGGAILARIGLWSFDLTVTQLFQEEVVECERGVVNGVQQSLNNFMDLIHFVLVIILPSPGQYGLLVLISAAFVAFGHFLYGVFARKVGGNYCLCR